MIPFLKNHPFPVEAFFENSYVLTFALPKERLQTLIPECLSLDLLDDKWAFLAMAMVQTKGLRPKGLPGIFGSDFFLIDYRVFVRYTNSAGKRLRGLYILKSETDKRKMEVLGNIFTHYNYTTTDIEVLKQGKRVVVSSHKSDFRIEIQSPDENILLPGNSPFVDWKEARKFAGPLPFTFTYNSNTKEVLIIEGMRQNWTPRPVTVIDYNISFLRSNNFDDAVLANAFVIGDVPYHWKKGKIDLWQG
jgi:Uncharacterized conserved protein (COG2071)